MVSIYSLNCLRTPFTPVVVSLSPVSQVATDVASYRCIFSYNVCPEHPWQRVSTLGICPLSQSHRGQAFFLKMSCQDSLNACSDSPTLNDLMEGSALGRAVRRIDYRLK
jgi:hypothetical protein